MRPSSSLIDEGTIAAFERDGAVPIRECFVPWVESLRRGIETNIAQPGPDARDYRDEGGGRFFGDYCNWSRIPEYKEFLFESPAADIARALVRSRTARLFHEHVLVKEAQTEIPTPWRQDLPFRDVTLAHGAPLEGPEFPLVRGSARAGGRYSTHPSRRNSSCTPGQHLELLATFKEARPVFRKKHECDKPILWTTP